MKKVPKIQAKYVASLVLVLILSLSFTQMVHAEQSVEVNAEIGAKLIFNATPKKLKLSVDPMDKPTAQAANRLQVKTNAPSYSITAAYGSFEVKDYDLIENGNIKVSAEAPEDGDGTGGLVSVADEVELLAGESGRVNNEVTGVNYQLEVDYTVPFGEATTTVVYTASMST